MKKLIFALCFATILSATSTLAQIPSATHIAILKAEDARRYDKTLEDLLKSPNVAIRNRAALAAGRIGDERAIPALTGLLFDQTGMDAAFALGEIESIKAADTILPILTRLYDPKADGEQPSGRVSARLIEAAGKIAAANANDPKAKELGNAILGIANRAGEREAILPTLTALLRARPAGAEESVRKFLAFTDPNIVADALNTLARMRAKNANRDARDLLETHVHAIVRANAARVLGAAEDKEATDVLIKLATTDTDSRVRVAAIRALAAIKDAKAAEPLLTRGEKLMDAMIRKQKPDFKPPEKSEFIEIAVALGRLLPHTRNKRALALFHDFGNLDVGRTAEVYIARVRISPSKGENEPPSLSDWRQYSTLAQVVGEFSAIEPVDDEGKRMKVEAPGILRPMAKAFAETDPVKDKDTIMAGPDLLQAFARFKTAELGEIARLALLNKDVQMRATAAGILADLPSSEENIDALNTAFDYAWERDIQSNDAILATMDALFKVDKQNSRASITAYMLASGSPDQLVRAKALSLLRDDAYKNKPVLQAFLNSESAKNLSVVRPYNGTGTKNGQILNKEIDYRRAASRRNGTVKAVLTTEKGTFTINFLPEDAPLTVDNFIKLARAKYFDGLEVHRVVPNFVMQDGDPRGDGNGGPGWSIRCEVNMVPYERGAVGMALSGKDTGGSQWFVTHSPQPHLDGGYTVFGKVNETGMKVVDKIVRGDKILTVRIIGK